ncbi:PPM1B [Lepeophtheirus salmonis]|uniref:PPM1B n=1 Tax=Lepeophtheirus salmonis TaxID=72036 RepID=A0A7R8CVN1_LEPSM|nr:PPM1B [Lepeophtheirus salmonis]CAF2944663.1 PPM1B [Lepeophtheirus salmonis]
MGAFLDKPKTEKYNESGSGAGGIRYGLSSMQGWRIEMEDAHSAVLGIPGIGENVSWFAVFDGHAGSRVSAHCSRHLLDCLSSISDFRDSIIAEKRHSRRGTQGKKVANGEDRSGTTAVCALITEKYIVLSNCGDSRGVISRQTSIPVLSTVDHKPSNPFELDRIVNAGGAVMTQRVNGFLAVSRSLGDFDYKKLSQPRNESSHDNMSIIIIALPGAPKVCPEAIERDTDLDSMITAHVKGRIDEDPRLRSELIFQSLQNLNLPNLPPGGGLYSKKALMEEEPYYNKLYEHNIVHHIPIPLYTYEKMSESGDDKKSHLSHALSLPLEETNERSIRKQQSLRIRPVSKPVPEESVPPPIKDRSWSFGNVAKAVVQGSKVVGSGVVQGTKAVGSGVVQGTMVVGSGVVSVGSGVIEVGTSVGTGVVHGTKMAGKVTKDVTMAAGKGVFTAGEIVGSAAVSGVSAVGTATVNAGMAVGEASATALNDTTKWVVEKKSRILQPGQEFDEYDILPGETLESVSEANDVDVEILILINELQSRNHLSGKRILLPNAELKKSITEKDAVLPFTHCMDHVRIRASLSLTSSLEEFVFFVTEFYKQDNGDDNIIFTKDIELIEIGLVSHEEFPSCPELLPPDALEHINSSDDDESTKLETTNGSSSDDKRGQLNEGLVFDVDTKNITPASCLDSSLKKDYKITLTYLEDSYLFKEFGAKLKMGEDLRPIIDAKQFGIDINDDSFTYLRLPTLITPSRVLTEDHIRYIYKYLPPQNQNESWNLEYSTSSDGFSLQNLYRRLGNARDPVLITIQDNKDTVFGVFLTCVPRVTEVFIGNGNSWLFSCQEGKKDEFEYDTIFFKTKLFTGCLDCDRSSNRESMRKDQKLCVS